jgi:Uma2 family endonuclease
MSTHVLPKQRMKVPEFLAWSDKQPETTRYELVDGEIIAMTRDTVRHNRAKSAAFIALRDAIRKAGVPCEAFIDGVGVKINDRTLRIPDVLVQCGVGPDPVAMVVESPGIVLEVVSPSSEHEDIETKFIDYFAVPSIRHYLIVYPTKGVVLHHRRKEGGEIASVILHDGEVALSPPGLTVPVAALLGPSFEEESEAGR